MKANGRAAPCGWGNFPRPVVSRNDAGDNGDELTVNVSPGWCLMLRLIWIACLFILAADSAAAQAPKPDPAAELFKPGVPVPKFKITLDDDNLKQLNKDPRKYVRAAVDINGQNFPDVGIHIKGAAGSSRGWNDRPALTLNFDKFTKSQTWLGLDKIHLNNSVQDGSFFNEILGSELAAALKLPTARTAHAVLELNDKSQQRRKLGIYVLKEGYNRAWLQRAFPEGPNGNLYDGGFLQDIDGNLKLDSGNGANKDELKKLADACREGDAKKRFERVSALVDVNLIACNIALQYVTCDWDGYVRNRNNYRLYFRSNDGKAVLIPHGMDQLFGNLNDSLRPGAGGMIARAFMESDDGRKLVDAKMREIVEKHFKPDLFNKRIDEWVVHMKDSLKGSSNEQWGKDFENNAKGVKDRLKQRYDYLVRELPKLK